MLEASTFATWNFYRELFFFTAITISTFSFLAPCSTYTDEIDTASSRTWWDRPTFWNFDQSHPWDVDQDYFLAVFIFP